MSNLSLRSGGVGERKGGEGGTDGVGLDWLHIEGFWRELMLLANPQIVGCDKLGQHMSFHVNFVELLFCNHLF